MKHYIEEIKEKLTEFYGKDDWIVDENGTLYIGSIPGSIEECGSQLYFHIFYKGLNDSEINDLENRIERNMSEELKDFYRVSNGLSLFAGSLSIGGLIDRTPSSSNPIDLRYGNTVDRPMKEGEFTDNSNEIRFGGYGIDHFDLLVNLDKKNIYAVPRFAPEPIYYEWVNFKEFLISEINRFIGLAKVSTKSIDSFNPLPTPW
ncbi:hypothetical protein ACFLRS_01140 [Campylobacterota bacterium]